MTLDVKVGKRFTLSPSERRLLRALAHSIVSALDDLEGFEDLGGLRPGMKNPQTHVVQSVLRMFKICQRAVTQAHR